MTQREKPQAWLGKLENWLLPPLGQRPPVLLSLPADLEDELAANLTFWQQGCPRCAMPGTTNHVCGACLSHASSLDQTQALLIFNDAAKHIIHGLKYQGELFWSRVVAEMMAQRIDATGVDAIIAVPLHPQRLVERGFNQSYEVSKLLAKQLGVPLLHKGIKRSVDTPHQTQLDKQQRQRNLTNAFDVENDFLAGLEQVVLLDDVMTTGATLEQLAKTLKKRYPNLKVQAWVIARAV